MAKQTDEYKWEISCSVNIRNVKTGKRQHVFTTTMFPPTRAAAMQIAKAYEELLENISNIYMLVANHIFGVE